MARSILHMLTPLKHMSPFDVNMAVDAGFETIVTYTDVTLPDVVSLTQDSIFSRAPGDGVRTGIFIGGKNAEDALDMVDRARKAFVPPFANHLFADPAGSFTTGAAMVAQVSRALRQKFGTGLKDKRIVIFGGAGVVAYVAAVIGALEGARTVLVGHDGEERVSKIAFTMKWRFGIEVGAIDGTMPDDRRKAIADADVILSAGPAGIPILSAEDLRAAPNLLVASDVNAVPPAGIAGIDVNAVDVALPVGKGVGIGALAVGNVKYQTQKQLFGRMLAAEAPLCLDFRDAYALAVEIAG
ncbi:methylenetetrahydromethanopterin dehydrogenase [Methylobacterium sp. WL30]|uniref:NAD(P)-dependent methylenetetrahydromethanopterin dehydrogenase n=1 Tax=unclassified Methylobacterium TaxID=2615210 RepID=UPI0011C9642F|nr:MULTISPECIES: NAD(P)-dependent methylenetetrahydromethanopterin dehydrogenase [unclassified Methylobacterium]TXM90739.1 methylenetetrahydromethanopterin dehydrogenase [Methylobacterium sp. WL116]TXN39087.1 methylenetetrahydromethanopterin dehydrogenase [Methylobacterium sp. WL93]TXN52638.1 methylenetetrahydromethanopterin dehydrogenase [Methylobacterium sp. WL119]TXN69998.1 methylenetetrahydromethanopterin dehydrogenase [Methylobacterium sp. WL30]